MRRVKIICVLSILHDIPGALEKRFGSYILMIEKQKQEVNIVNGSIYNNICRAHSFSFFFICWRKSESVYHRQMLRFYHTTQFTYVIVYLHLPYTLLLRIL